MESSAPSFVPCTRLRPSRVAAGDKVILLGDASIDGQWGFVRELLDRGRFAVVVCRLLNHGTYPPSCSEREVTVPRACAFDLNDAACRQEWVHQCINRSLGLQSLLSSKLGDKALDEVYLTIAKHLVDYSQCLLIFSGYRQKMFSNVFSRHFSQKKGYWLQVSKLPSPRIDAAVMAPAPGCIVFAGGVDDHPSVGSPLKTVVSYDALTKEWIALPSLNIRRHGCCGVVFRGSLFVFGGAYAQVASSSRTMLEEAESGLPFYESLDLEAHARLRRENKAALSNSGGGGGHGNGGLGEPASSLTGAWVPGMRQHEGMETTDRLFFACGVVRGKVVLAGGEIPRASSSVRNRYTFEYRLHTVFETTSRCEAFDPERDEWRPVASMKEARVGAAFCTWKGNLVVAGGQNEHKRTLGSVEMFDGKEWIQLPDLQQPRFHASMAVWNGVLTIVGGSYEDCATVFTPGTVPSVQFTDKVEQYVPELQRWQVCKNLRTPIAFHACVCQALNMTDA